MSGITIGVNKARYLQMEKNAYVGRKAAIEAGVKVYVGKQCKNCGVKIKRTSNGTCLYCMAQCQVKLHKGTTETSNIRKRAHDAEERALMKSFEL